MISPQHLSREISLNELADIAELPILVSDDYFGFHYPNRGTGHAAAVSHDARAEIYPINLRRHLKDRQVLGVTYCAAMYDQADNENAQDQQNGFYDVQGTPRTHLIQVVTETNKSIYMHTPHPSTTEELQSLQRELFETWDKYNCGDW